MAAPATIRPINVIGIIIRQYPFIAEYIDAPIPIRINDSHPPRELESKLATNPAANPEVNQKRQRMG